MAGKSTRKRVELCDELYQATVRQLLARLKSEECTAADVKNAREFLKDNSITASSENFPLHEDIEEALKDVNVLPFPR